jgi:hypothetical protein
MSLHSRNNNYNKILRTHRCPELEEAQLLSLKELEEILMPFFLWMNPTEVRLYFQCLRTRPSNQEIREI